MLSPWTSATVALLLSLREGAFGPERVEAVAGTRTERTRDTRDGAPRGAHQRIADRVIARRVRGAIRADPFLALASPAVKVTSTRGVVRLSGQVRTAKERSSIAFKARQIAGAGSVDDRVTVAPHVDGAAP